MKAHEIDFHIQKFTAHLLLNTAPIKAAQAEAPAARTRHRLEELWPAGQHHFVFCDDITEH